jgi:hypothetical protein
VAKHAASEWSPAAEGESGEERLSDDALGHTSGMANSAEPSCEAQRTCSDRRVTNSDLAYWPI